MDPTGPPPVPNPRFGHIPAPAAVPPSYRHGGRPGGAVHRRAHSETSLILPDDDIILDCDADFSIPDIGSAFPSLSDDNVSGGDGGGTVAVDSGRSDQHAATPMDSGRPVVGAHLRSLSLDAAFFDELGFLGGAGAGGVPERKGHHRRSGSMDGSSSSFEGDSSVPGMSDYAKKAMTSEKLAELALIDPKRAKRILANRQSAARSKERKIRYTSELERKVQTLQTEATTLSAQLTLLQRDTTGLTAENRELKLRLQAMEQQAQLRDALNQALGEEVQRLKIATGQLPNVADNPFNGGLQQPVANYFSHPQQLPRLGGHQAQQLHPSQAQSPSDGQSLSSQSLDDSMDFM